MGDLKRWVNAGGLWDPAGAANRVVVSQHSPNAGGKVGQMYNDQINKPINIHNTLDPGGNLRQQTTGVQGSADPLTGKPTVIGNYNPNAPGSIFNMGRGQGMPFNPNIGVPANGVSTNGFQPPPMPQQPQQPIGGFNPQGGTPNMGLQNGPQVSPQNGPNWGSIIAQAMQGPPKTVNQGMPVGPRFQQ